MLKELRWFDMGDIAVTGRICRADHPARSRSTQPTKSVRALFKIVEAHMKMAGQNPAIATN
jgi:hypothetical protein